MESKNIVIFTGGSYGPAEFYENKLKKIVPDVIIAADRGAEMVAHLGLEPDMMVGDFDSVDATVFDTFKNQGVPVLRHPVHKDQTDTELAIDVAIQNDADVVTLFGATGTRIDHVFASIAAMTRLTDQGIGAQIIDPDNELHLVKGPRDISLHLSVGTTISLTALSDDAGPVTLAGFEYPLENARLSFRDAGLTVSNYAVDRTQRIVFDAGLLLIDIVKEKESAQSDTAQ